jgi:hypothetical protein
LFGMTDNGDKAVDGTELFGGPVTGASRRVGEPDDDGDTTSS